MLNNDVISFEQPGPELQIGDSTEDSSNTRIFSYIFYISMQTYVVTPH